MFRQSATEIAEPCVATEFRWLIDFAQLPNPPEPAERNRYPTRATVDPNLPIIYTSLGPWVAPEVTIRSRFMMWIMDLLLYLKQRKGQIYDYNMYCCDCHLCRNRSSTEDLVRVQQLNRTHVVSATWGLFATIACVG